MGDFAGMLPVMQRPASALWAAVLNINSQFTGLMCKGERAFCRSANAPPAGG